jgi:hypothetical protein
MDPFTMMIAGQTVSGLSQMASSQKADYERKIRFATFMAYLEDKRKTELATGTKSILEDLRGRTQAARASGARRALAMGKTSEAEAFIAPIEGRVASQGSDTLRRFIENVNKNYDAMAVQAQAGYSGREIPMNVGDVVGATAGAVSNYAAMQPYLDAIKSLNANQQTPTNLPTAPGVPWDEGSFQPTMLDVNRSDSKVNLTSLNFKVPKVRNYLQGLSKTSW